MQSSHPHQLTYKQEPIVKLQVLTLASKLQVLLTSPHPTTNPTTTITLLTRYIFSLARYDVNYDVRDRARMLGSLLAGISPSLRLYLNGNSNSSSNTDNDDEDKEGDEEGDEEGEGQSNNRAYRRGGVVLRREQVRLVLFEGKSVVQDRPLSKGKFRTPPVRSILIFFLIINITLTHSHPKSNPIQSKQKNQNQNPHPPSAHSNSSPQNQQASSPTCVSPTGQKRGQTPRSGIPRRRFPPPLPCRIRLRLRLSSLVGMELGLPLLRGRIWGQI